MRLLTSLGTTLEMIKFEHTIFALPFALLSTVLASEGLPEGGKLFWIVVAMVGARSAAMAFNRLADRRIDAQNPRTQTRALPAGQLSVGFVALFTLASCLLFVLAAFQLNPLCFRLSFPVLGILFFYSYTKRFTQFSHFFLGLCLGLAPLGAWIAVRGDVQPTPLLLCLIVLLWTAGFDIIYACQDVDFDERQNLFSLPKQLGVGRALMVSRSLHAAVVFLLVLFFFMEQLGWLSLLGIGLVGGLLAYEHSLVRPNDLSRINAAFFTVNGYVSVLLFLTVGLDRIWF
ncbi:MAG: UbiA-like polyprenyltransferase [Acidobacteriota bacterium]